MYRSMRSYSSSNDHSPFHIAGHALSATALVIVIFVASMVATTILSALGMGRLIAELTYSSSLVLEGRIWQVITYAFLNPPSLNFAIDMLMLWWFGREVEKFFGRRLFLRLYLMIVLLPPILGLLFINRNVTLAGEPGSFAIFVAFATLYPNAVLLFGILAKWAGIAWVAIGLLSAMSRQDWQGFIMVLATSALGFCFVRYEQGRLELPRISFTKFSPTRIFEKKPKFRVVRKEEVVVDTRPRDESSDTVDALLDKIARSGMKSLTDRERALLEKARQDLLRKGK